MRRNHRRIASNDIQNTRWQACGERAFGHWDALAGALSEGLKITVHPAASAAATLPAGESAGKFQAVTPATGPTGWYWTCRLTPRSRPWGVCPKTRRVSSDIPIELVDGGAVTPRASAIGFPVSADMTVAMRSRRLSSSATIRRSDPSRTSPPRFSPLVQRL